MLITNVRAHHIRIPYDAGVASFKQGASAISALEIVMVEVSTDAGITGWGDAFAMSAREPIVPPSRR
jgi:L-alanine-DL-glutamate epimerase-like enolase superfamily enzyme